MARRTARGGGRAKPERQPKSRKPAAQVEVVEEEAGMGIEAGMAIATTILLVLAFFFIDALKGKFDAGIFL